MLIEDSPHDFYAVQRGLRSVELAEGLIHCETGEEAVAHLWHSDSIEDQKRLVRPHLILLDLNLPGMGGAEFLDKIKNDVDLKHIPVIVLTTSDDPKDIKQSYALGANSYLRKPLNRQAAQRLKEYWFDSAVLPE